MIASRAGYRRGNQGDILGLGKLIKKVGGFIPGIGSTISSVGGFIEGIGSSKPKPGTAIEKATTPGTFALPGGAMVGVDSIKVQGSGFASPILSAGKGSATIYTSSGKPRKKIRRMNALNPKALTRSIRRVDKFQHFARSVGFSRPPAKLKGIHAPKRRRRTVSCR